MGEENNQKIYLVRKKVGEVWKLVSLNNKLLKIVGTTQATNLINKLNRD
jgi:hypothetical protein